MICGIALFTGKPGVRVESMKSPTIRVSWKALYTDGSLKHSTQIRKDLLKPLRGTPNLQTSGKHMHGFYARLFLSRSCIFLAAYGNSFVFGLLMHA